VVLPAQQEAQGDLILALDGLPANSSSSSGRGRVPHTADQFHGHDMYTAQQHRQQQQNGDQEQRLHCRLVVFSQQRVWHEVQVPLQEIIR
jgi:hypothetical protein